MMVAMPAAGYERHLVPTIFRPWGQELLDRVAPQPGERVLDVASATGTMARRAAELVGPTGSCTAVDIDVEALDIGARSLDGGPVRWMVGDAQALPFADESFDVALCQQSLQGFDDAGLALREMRRVLVPAGRLAVSVWRELEGNDVYRVLLRALRAAASRHAPELTMPVGPFALGRPELLRAAVERAGFTAVRAEVVTRSTTFPSAAEFARGYFDSAPRRSHVLRLPDAAREWVIADCVRQLGPRSSAGPLTFDMVSSIVTARRPVG